MPGNLSKAIDLLQTTFDEYAGEDGDKNTLTKKELSKLIRSEFEYATTCKEEMDKFFKNLDNDGDGTVNFQEYVTFVASLATIQREDK